MDLMLWPAGKQRAMTLYSPDQYKNVQGSMAYHLLVRALRDAVGAQRAPNQLFAECIHATLQGHVPLHTFRQVGAHAQTVRGHESGLAASVADNFRFDLNPFGLRLKAAGTVAELMALHRRFNQQASLQIRSSLTQDATGRLQFDQRSLPGGLQDIEACRQVHVVAMEHLVGQIHAVGADHPSPGPRHNTGIHRVSELARCVVHGAALIHECLDALEEDPSQKLSALAFRLGFKTRTMQRHLARFGVSAEGLKRAVMLNHATRMLGSRRSLTEIAYTSGYADQAHMCRAFVSSCGLTPGQLRGQG